MLSVFCMKQFCHIPDTKDIKEKIHILKNNQNAKDANSKWYLFLPKDLLLIALHQVQDLQCLWAISAEAGTSTSVVWGQHFCQWTLCGTGYISYNYSCCHRGFPTLQPSSRRHSEMLMSIFSDRLEPETPNLSPIFLLQKVYHSVV